MREEPSISPERLRAAIEDQYDLTLTSLDYLPLGLDYRAGVYRMVSEDGISYFLKVKSGTFYEPGCSVPGYLSDQGITSVVAPLPTRSHALWSQIDDWTMMVYPFLEGETTWEGMTDEQWRETGFIFKQIHEVTLPPSGFPLLREETFSPSSYARWVRMCETQHLHDLQHVSASQRVLRSSWIDHKSTIHDVLARLAELAQVLSHRHLPLVVCHADLHPANLLRDHAGHVHVIDWDDVMLAPKERDFIFIKESAADTETLPGSPTFFAGYGSPDIDWVALTYYRYERVIQEVVACSETVFLRDDLGEDSKLAEAELFQDVFSKGGEIVAAIAASAHLPPDFKHDRGGILS